VFFWKIFVLLKSNFFLSSSIHSIIEKILYFNDAFWALKKLGKVRKYVKGGL
ncbi:hypothetical protein, partial [Terribacillus sp. AE2B 122]